MGTTSDGTAIAFDVSDVNIVTNITLGRDNRDCRDAQTFSGLSRMIGDATLCCHRPPGGLVNGTVSGMGDMCRGVECGDLPAA
jgi:hypothetical protein